MKSQDFARSLDLAGQLAMLFPLFCHPQFSAAGFAFTYLLVGTWQVLSFMIHCAASPSGRIRRKSYGVALGIVIILLVVISGLHIGSAVPVLTLFAICCGAMAIWYFGIGAAELHATIQSRQHRREIHWKL